MIATNSTSGFKRILVLAFMLIFMVTALILLTVYLNTVITPINTISTPSTFTSENDISQRYLSNNSRIIYGGGYWNVDYGWVAYYYFIRLGDVKVIVGYVNLSTNLTRALEKVVGKLNISPEYKVKIAYFIPGEIVNNSIVRDPQWSIYFVRYYKGHPVIGALPHNASIHVIVNARTYEILNVEIDNETTRPINNLSQPRISMDEALEIAKQYLESKGINTSNCSQECINASLGILRFSEKAKIWYLREPLDKSVLGKFRLCWIVVFRTHPLAGYIVIVDAETGRILAVHDYVRFPRTPWPRILVKIDNKNVLGVHLRNITIPLQVKAGASLLNMTLTLINSVILEPGANGSIGLKLVPVDFTANNSYDVTFRVINPYPMFQVLNGINVSIPNKTVSMVYGREYYNVMDIKSSRNAREGVYVLLLECRGDAWCSFPFTIVLTSNSTSIPKPWFTCIDLNGNTSSASVFCCPGPVGYAVSTGAVLSGSSIGVDLYVWKPEDYGFRGVFVVEIIDSSHDRVVLNRTIKWNEVPVEPRYISIRLPVNVSQETDFIIRVRAIEEGVEVDRLESSVKVLARKLVEEPVNVDMNYTVITNYSRILNYLESANLTRILEYYDNPALMNISIRIENIGSKPVYIPATGCKCDIIVGTRIIEVEKGNATKVTTPMLCPLLCCIQLKPNNSLRDNAIYVVQRPFKAGIVVSVRICDVCSVRCSTVEKEFQVHVP